MVITTEGMSRSQLKRIATGIACEDCHEVRPEGATRHVAEVAQNGFKVEDGRNSAGRVSDRLLIVVRLAIDVTIEPGLDPVLEWVECEGDKEPNDDLHLKRRIIGSATCQPISKEQHRHEADTRDDCCNEIDSASANH